MITEPGKGKHGGLMIANPDDFDLERFRQAQDSIYHRVVNELSQGKKQSHWMWFIFPQIKGLGQSSTAQEFAIQSSDEALAYLQDTLLGGRLNECCQLMLTVENKTAAEILGYPDDIKLRSSMTLFDAVSEHESIFRQVLDKYFKGEADQLTLTILSRLH